VLQAYINSAGIASRTRRFRTWHLGGWIGDAELLRFTVRDARRDEGRIRRSLPPRSSDLVGDVVEIGSQRVSFRSLGPGHRVVGQSSRAVALGLVRRLSASVVIAYLVG
jgi:hypothetical protein